MKIPAFNIIGTLALGISLLGMSKLNAATVPNRFVTNSDAIAMVSISTNRAITNLFVTSPTISFDRGALDVRLASNTPAPDGMPVSIHSSTNEVTVSGIHLQTYNTNATEGAQAVDIGLWSRGFGADYNGKYVLDLYNTNLGSSTASAFIGPDYLINFTDARDGGVVTHPLVWGSFTNLTFNLLWRTNGSRAIIPGFVWDPTIGVMPFRNGAKENASPSGTISGSSRTITGSGTHFSDSRFGEAGFGDIIVVGTSTYHVKTAGSGTSLTVTEPISPTFSGTNYNVDIAPEKWLGINGTTVNSAMMADGTYMVRRANDGAWLRLIGSTKDYQLAEGGSGEFLIHNSTDNSNPFLMTSAGNLTLGGTNTASAFLTSGGFGSTASTASLAVGTDGITNTLAINYRLLGFTGTTVTQTNISTHTSFSRGTVVTPIDIILQPNEAVRGTSCAAQSVQAF